MDMINSDKTFMVAIWRLIGGFSSQAFPPLENKFLGGAGEGRVQIGLEGGFPERAKRKIVLRTSTRLSFTDSP